MLASRKSVPEATREFLAEVEAAKHDPDYPMSYNQQAELLGTSRQAIEQLADRHLPRAKAE